MYQTLINSLRYKNYCNNFRTEVEKKGKDVSQKKKKNVYQFVKPKLARFGCILKLAIKELLGTYSADLYEIRETDLK